MGRNLALAKIGFKTSKQGAKAGFLATSAEERLAEAKSDDLVAALEIFKITTSLASLYTDFIDIAVLTAGLDLEDAKKSLNKIGNNSDSIRKTLKKGEKIPIKTVKDISKVGDNSIKAFQDVIEKIENTVDPLVSQLAFYKKLEQGTFYKVAKVLDGAGTAVTAVEILQSEASMAFTRDAVAALGLEDELRAAADSFATSVAPPAFSVSASVSSGDAITTSAIVEQPENVLEIDLPDGFGEEFLAAQAIFDARFAERTGDFQIIEEAIAGFIEKANLLRPDGDFQAFANDLASQFQAITALLDKLDVLAELRDIADVLDAFDDVASIFEAVADAIEPVLDVFGPVTDLLNEAVEAVEDAIGLSTIKQRIQKAVDDKIDELTAPLLAELDKLLALLDIPEIKILDEMFENFQAYQNTVQGVIDRPIVLTDADVVEDDSDLSGKAVIVSSLGDDVITLKADKNFLEDGYGGYVIANDGDKKITGTSLKDLIVSGTGADTIFAGADDDVVVSGSAADLVSGGDGDDEIAGKQDDDTLRGDDGDDRIFGGLGRDVVFGGSGDDTLYGDGDSADDVPAPGEGLDPQTVEEYADYLEAGAGDDELYGGFGVDTLVATSGNNILDGGEGVDDIRTLGDADATHTILDHNARIFGGAGQDILELDDDYAAGLPVLDGVVFDAGSNFDTIKAGSLDLNVLDQLDPLTGLERIQNFETLHITALAGETKTLVTDVDSLNNFQTLILETEGVEFSEAGNGRALTPEEYGAIIIEVTGGDFVMSGFDANFPLIIDNSRLADLVNPHDGAEVDGFFPFFNSFVHSSKLNALTVRAAGDLAISGAVLTGNQATSDGFTFEGGDGADTITGSGGSDVIRAGLGADIINGGVSDSGNKFSNDSAVGDVIIGTLADFNGDQIFNLTNRVDRIRIEGSQDYFIETVPVLGADEEVLSTTVNVYGSSQLDIDENEIGAGEILSTFIVDGDNPKLTFRGGSYIPLGATVAVDYVELFNNNVPPVAVSDLVETRNLGDGDLDGTLFNPFENDFDPDAEVITNDDGSITRRQINEPASVLALLRQLSEADPNMPTVEVGARFDTELGNKIFYTQVEIDGVLVDQLFYEARDPSVTLRMIETGDAVGGFPTDVYDPTEALPFFGFDRIVYTNIDDEDETSDFAAINFIVRPDRVTDADGEMVLPSVEIFGVLDGQIIEQAEVQLNELAPNTSATGLDDQLTSGNTSPNAFLDTTFQNSDYLDIDAAGAYFGFSGGDVIDARDATGRVALFGGDGADWVEGGAGDDFLSGGGVNDIYLTPQTRTDGSKLPADAGSGYNVLLGGEGDNVFSASLGQLAPGFNNKTEGRDTVYVLDGGAETILGPMNDVAHDANDDLTFFPLIPFDYSATTALALDGDKVFGFDNDDQLVLPTNVGGLFFDQRDLASRSSGSDFGAATLNTDAEIKGAKATSLVLLSADEDANRLIPDLLTSSSTYQEVDTATVTNLNILPPTEFTINSSHEFDLQDEHEIPEFVLYDLDVQPSSDKSTIVNATFDGFGYDIGFEVIGIDIDVLNQTETEIAVGIVETETTFAFTTNYEATSQERSESYLDTKNLFGGGPVEFSIEFEGKYNPDRFAVELVPLETNGDFVDIDAPVGETRTTNGVDYLFYDAAEFEAATPQALGIAIVYNSFPPDAFDDQISVERGQTVTFNVFDDNGSGADSDADNDTLQIFDLVFEDKLLEAALLDGDDSNGELILETDLNTGLGTGAITFVANEAFYADADNAFNEITFGYIATDQEFNSEQATVTIDITGRRPQLGDDRIVLAADTDGLISIDQLLANDSDPDFVEGVGAEFDLSSLIFSVVGDDGLKGDITPDGTGYQLRDDILTTLRARDTDAFGGPTDYTRFTYRLEDIATGARSDFAIVEVAIAEELVINNPLAVAAAAPSAPAVASAVSPLTVAEDGSIAINVLEGRIGGFGDVELSVAPDSKAFAKGTTTVVGDLVVSGDEVIFTPIADLSDFTAEIEVTATDQAGQTVDVTFEVFVAPVEDSPVALLLSFTNGVATLDDQVRVDEDAIAEEDLYIYDPDAVTALSVDVASGFLSDVVTYISEVASLETLQAVADGTAQLAGQNEFGDVDLVTTRGGDFTIFAPDSETFRQYSFLGLEDQNGTDLLEIAFLPLTEGGEGDVLEIEIFIDPVNDAPVFVDDLGDDPFVPETTLVDIGEVATFNLLEGVLDIDGEIDATTLAISAGAATPFATVDLNAETGVLTLTGVASGSGTLTYSVKDDQGLSSGPRGIDFKINSAPVAVDDRFVVAAPFAPILIDAIANDTDTDGVLSYVLGEDGLPVAIDPQSSLGFESDIDSETPLGLTGEGGLLGQVEWSVAEQAFVYTAPTDVSKLGQTDQFFYEVMDDDGSVARGLVVIDLISTDPTVTTFRVSNEDEGVINAFVGSEVFVLGETPRVVKGNAAELDGDRIADFSPEDSLLITDAPEGLVTITTTRDRGDFPAASIVEANAPTAAEVFGDTPVDAITSAFVGDTLLTIEAGGVTTTLRLDGAFLGDFTATSTPDGLAITYAATATAEGGAGDDEVRGNGVLIGNGGDDILIGGDQDDDLRGGDGRDVLIGKGGANTLTGGDGADLFILSDPEAMDAITDYNPAEGDRIVLSDGEYLDDDLSALLSVLTVAPDGDGFLIIGEIPESDTSLTVSALVAAAGSTAQMLARFELSALTDETPPRIESDTFSIGEGQTNVGTVVATDGQTGVTYSISGGPDATLFAIDSANGALTFLAAPDFEAPADLGGDNLYQVEVTAKDLSDNVASQLLSVTVTNVNEAPSITSGATLTAVENQTVAGAVMASDDAAGVSFAISGGADAALFAINAATGALSFKSAPDFETPGDVGGDNVYNVRVTATDAGGQTAVQSLAVTVSDVNELLAITSGAVFTAAENQTAVTTVTAEDDAAGVTFALTGGADAALFAINAATGVLSFKSAPDFETPGDVGGDNVHNIQITATDAGGLTGVQSLVITVTDVNEAPTITSGAAFTAAENQTVAGAVMASDDKAGAMFAITGGADAALFAINATTGALRFKSAPNFEAPGDVGGDNVHDIMVTVTDSGGLTFVQSATVTVTDVNEAPVAAASSATGDEDTVISGALLASDIDGDTLNFALVDGPSNGSVTVSTDGSFQFTPVEDFNGTDSFTFRASDGALSDTAIARITVNPVDEPFDPVDPVDPPAPIDPPGPVDPVDTVDPVDPPNPVDPPAPSGPTQGDDTLLGTALNDTINALAGNDNVSGLAGDDLLLGGGGNDSIKGAAGDDRLRGNGGDDTLKGGGGDDNIKGNGGEDVIRGNGGDDVIRAGGGADNVKGGGGADLILGGGGADKLNGGGGADTLKGNGGDDTLKGNGGADVFQFRTSDRNDTIADFRQGQDKIQIQNGVRTFAGLDIEQDGRDVLIGFGAGQVRVITDNAGAFDEGDFIF